MTSGTYGLAAAAAVLFAAQPCFGQKQELGLTLGSLLSQSRSLTGGDVDSGSGMALQANYGLRLIGGGKAAIYFETHFLASPQRKVTSSLAAASTDYASLYIAPGARIKFAPNARISPWAAIGGGYAQYENSELNAGGRPNGAPRREHHGTFAFGGGVDVKALRWLSLRGEIRDFYGTGPNYGVPGSPSKQHNLAAGGGFVLRFGE